MKTIIVTLTMALATFLSKAQTDATTTGDDMSNTDGTTVTVTVAVPSDEGNVMFGLWDESTFMKAAPLQGLESDIVDGKATVTFANVTAGVYGVTLFHDKNGNKTMDFDPNGMPLEMYGVSNNVMSYGPPQWSDAKFEVAGVPLELEIRM